MFSPFCKEADASISLPRADLASIIFGQMGALLEDSPSNATNDVICVIDDDDATACEARSLSRCEAC